MIQSLKMQTTHGEITNATRYLVLMTSEAIWKSLGIVFSVYENVIHPVLEE